MPNEFIFGRQSVLESLRAGQRTLHKIWIQERTGGPPVQEIIELAKAKGIPMEWARREQLDRKVQGHHQGIVAQASAVNFLELEEFLGTLSAESPALLVAMDEIQDPHNVGAILRSAGFFGVNGAIVPRWRSAPVGDTAARVSSGAIERVPLIRVRNLAESLKGLQDSGFEVIGADMEGEPIADHPQSLRTVIVFGSEGKGLRRLVRERCDKLLKIPGAGEVGSLNVAAAAAIFLYEFTKRCTTETAQR